MNGLGYLLLLADAATSVGVGRIRGGWGYIWASYGIVWATLTLYAVSLWLRQRSHRRGERP